MKKIVLCIVALLAAVIACTSSSAPVPAVQETSPVTDKDSVRKPADSAAKAEIILAQMSAMDLDAAIKAAALKMGTNLPAKTEVALVSLASTSTLFSEYVISRLEAALVDDGKLIVLDRANLDRVREEQGFQISGEVDDNSAKAIGRLLGAGAIVTGSFINLGDVYGLSLKAINMETAAIAASYPADIAKSIRIETLLASGGTTARPAAAKPAASPVQATPAARPPASVTYKIGDTGPAGGLIFYDKGNNSGGWRYLEAAPEDISRRLAETEEGIGIEAQRAVGTGKANTQAIMVQANNRGGGFGWAAQACDALEVNGFDDWFLPSRDELHYMYGNLHMRNLGGFSLDWYWSSTYSHYNERELYTYANRHYWWAENFSNGKQAAQCGNRYAGSYGGDINNLFRIRPIRQF